MFTLQINNYFIVVGQLSNYVPLYLKWTIICVEYAIFNIKDTTRSSMPQPRQITTLPARMNTVNEGITENRIQNDEYCMQ